MIWKIIRQLMQAHFLRKGVNLKFSQICLVCRREFKSEFLRLACSKECEDSLNSFKGKKRNEKYEDKASLWDESSIT